MRHSVAAAPSPCRQRLSQSSSSRHSGWSCDGRDLIPAPVDYRRRDPLFQATIRKTFETGCFCGKVVNVELDARTGEGAYHVLYEDGDEEHMTGAEVQNYMVNCGFAGKRLSAPALLQSVRLPQLQLESESWPRVARKQHTISGGWRSLMVVLFVCILASFWASSPCWSCILGSTDGSASDHTGTREQWEEQTPPPWEVLAALGAPSSAPQAAEQQEQLQQLQQQPPMFASDPLAQGSGFKSLSSPQSSPPVPPWQMQTLPREDLRTGLQRGDAAQEWLADSKRIEVAHMPAPSRDTMPPAIPPWKREELALDPYQDLAAQTLQPMAGSAQPSVGSPFSGGTESLSETMLEVEAKTLAPALPSEQEESGEPAADGPLMKLREAWGSAAQAAKMLFAFLQSDSSATGLSPSEDESSAYSNAIAVACVSAGVLVLLFGICWGGCSHSPMTPTCGATVISADGDVFHAVDPVPPVGSPSAASRLSGASPFMAATPLAASPLAAVVPAASPLGVRAPSAASPVTALRMAATPLAASPLAAAVPATSPLGVEAPPAASPLTAWVPDVSAHRRFVPTESPSVALATTSLALSPPAAAVPAASPCGERPLPAASLLAASPMATPKVAAPTPAATRKGRPPRATNQLSVPVQRVSTPSAASTAASLSATAGPVRPRSKLIQQEPRFRYTSALRKFTDEFGFEDTSELRDILIMCQGNVRATLEYLGVH